MAHGAQPSGPLFVKRDGQAYTKDEIRDKVQLVANFLRMPDTVTLGAHSLRIAGAMDVFTNGGTAEDLKLSGRWGSEVAFVYLRFCKLRQLQVANRTFAGVKRSMTNRVLQTEATPDGQ